MTEGLTSAQTVLQDFAKILKPSFGPYGKEVLLKSDTGVLYLSKDGGFVVKHLEIKHPVGILIKNTLNRLDLLLGDFTKTFVLVLAHFIKSLATCVSTLPSVNESNNQLSSIWMGLFAIKERIFPTCENKKSCFLNDISICLTPSQFFADKYFQGLMEASLLSKVNHQSKKTFIMILESIANHPNFSFHSLRSLSKYFDEIVIPIQGIPLECSKVVDGLIIQRECIPKHVDKENIKFITVTGGSVGALNIEHNFLYCSQPSFSRKQKSEVEFHEKLLNFVQGNDISLLLCEEALPKTLQNVLLSAGITVVIHVGREDIERIMVHYDISLLSGLYDVLNLNESQNVIGHASFFKSTVVGTRYSCHLGPSVNTTSSATMNIQILFCCTSEGLGVQYKRILHQTFQVLLQAYDDGENKAKLLSSCCSSEIYMASFFYDLSKTLDCSTERELARMLSQSFLEVPKLVYDNSTAKNKTRFLLPLQIECQKHLLNVGLDSRTGKLIVEGGNVTLYEPLNSKIILVQTILEISGQIVRIQHVIPVHRQISCSRDDSDGCSDDEV